MSANANLVSDAILVVRSQNASRYSALLLATATPAVAANEMAIVVLINIVRLISSLLKVRLFPAVFMSTKVFKAG